MMFVIWSPWWYGLWVSAYSVHIAQAEKLKEASEKRFRFSPIYFGVYSSKNRESKRQHCRVSASARSQLMVFISSSLRLSLIFFLISVLFIVSSVSHTSSSLRIFSGMWFSIQSTCVAVVTMIVMWTSHTEANIPTLCVEESRSKGFFGWTPHFGASRCNSKRDSIEWSLTQNGKEMYEADICVSTAYTAPRTSSSLILLAMSLPMQTGFTNEIGGERNAME